MAELHTPTDSLGQVHPVTVWNRAQFVVHEVTLVPPASAKEPAKRVMAEVLEIDGFVLDTEFVSGSLVSFLREKVQGGTKIVITTEEPVYVDTDGYTLVLFDDAFRLLGPGHPQNPYGNPQDGSD